MPEDIRWVQRLQNFEKSIHNLELAIKIDRPDIVQRAGLIQFFEISFELSWNLMKDYLEAQGFTGVRSPRDAIKKAFETGLIANGHEWLDALENRNLSSHTYDEETAERIATGIINKYYPLLKDVLATFKQK
jgi:nucleotidyltransferase substrate binding protein (TIGR01987 family)